MASGMEMMLKSMGFDVEEFKTTMLAVREQVEGRMLAIETKLDLILLLQEKHDRGITQVELDCAAARIDTKSILGTQTEILSRCESSENLECGIVALGVLIKQLVDAKPRMMTAEQFKTFCEVTDTSTLPVDSNEVSMEQLEAEVARNTHSSSN